MITCSCPMCRSSFTVEVNYMALAQAKGESPEVATGRFHRSLTTKTPVGVNVKCPKCAHVCDIATAYVSSGF
jgi:hypothetical protein